MAVISNYVRPQSSIRQELQLLISRQNVPRPACVVAPHYQLHRFGVDAAVPGIAFDSTGVELEYVRNVAGMTTAVSPSAVVDTAWTRVFGTGLEAQYAAFTPGGDVFELDVDAPNLIRLSADSVAGSNLNADLYGRAARVGDVVVVTQSGQSVRRTVTGFRGKALVAHYGTDSGKADTLATNGVGNPVTQNPPGTPFTSISAPVGATLTADNPEDFNGLVAGAITEGQYGDVFTATVAVAGAPGVAEFNIVSDSGAFAMDSVDTADDSGDFTFPIAGVVMRIEGLGALTLGQVFRFRILGNYTRINTATQLLLAGAFTGPRDTTYVIRVKEGVSGSYNGAVLEVYDTAGSDTPSEVTLAANTPFALGAFGLTAEFASPPTLPVQNGLRTGDTYFVHAVAAAESTLEFDGIILSGPALAPFVSVPGSRELDSVSLRAIFTGEILATAVPIGADPAWESNAASVEVDGGLSLQMPERDAGFEWVPFVDNVGTLSLTWRAVMPRTEPVLCYFETEIIEAVGPIVQANTLAYGAAVALEASGDLPVLLIGTGGVDADAFAATFERLSRVKSLYAMAVLSDDPDVRSVAKTHVNQMSAPNVKRFRRAYTAAESPGSFRILGLNSAGASFTATISDYLGQNVLVTTLDTEADFTSKVSPGDRFVVPVLNTEFVIGDVISDTELLLTSGPAAPVTPAATFEIWRPDTAAAQVQFLREQAQALADRRVALVWTEGGTVSSTEGTDTVSNMFIAAEIAGLRTALLPQRGLTRTEISSITAATPTFSRYSEQQLNDIAAAGVLVVVQDGPGDPVYVRHQLTTGVAGGLLAYEDSIGVVVDTVSFSVNDITEAFVGKTNLTERTIIRIRQEVEQMLTDYTTNVVSQEAGPVLVGYRDLTFRQDPNARDRLIIRVVLQVGSPLNYIETTLEVESPVIVLTT